VGYQGPVQRMLLAACLDADVGLNAQIAKLGTDGLLSGGDPPPPTFAPGAIGIEVGDANVGQGDFPDAVPALAIVQPQVAELQGEVMTLAGTRTIEAFPVLFQYRHEKVDLAEAIRDWDYTARALLRMLRELMKEPYAATHRTEAHVRIVSFDRGQLLAPFKTYQGAVATGGLLLSLTLRDLKP
jgi:hypothetical protein